jgi:hypothetical protein
MIPVVLNSTQLNKPPPGVLNSTQSNQVGSCSILGMTTQMGEVLSKSLLLTLPVDADES